MTARELRRAIDAALAGKWHDAHGIVQADEADPIACWIHAVLHKTEGDSGNARYWYQKAGRLDHVNDEATAELAMIRDAISG
jgi:hypothetical protein